MCADGGLGFGGGFGPRLAKDLSFGLAAFEPDLRCCGRLVEATGDSLYLGRRLGNSRFDPTG